MNAGPKDIQPEDLVTAKEAALMADRSKASIRTWVRLKKLTGYKQDPYKRNSALMVSKSELLAFLANNKSPDKLKQAGRASDISMSVAKLEEEKKLLELQLKMTQEKIELLVQLLVQAEELADNQKRAIAAENSRNKEYKQENRLLKEELACTRLRLDQMSFYLSLPWWKKLNTTVPLLEAKM